MKKINWIKNNKKSIFAFVLGAVLFSLITVFVAIVVESNKITEAKAKCPEGSICHTPVSFAEDDWLTIAAAVRSGDYPYQVGDTKTIDMDDFGTHVLRVANTTACTNGETSQTACGFVVEFADIITTHPMRFEHTIDTETNVGGWRDSAMRTFVNETIYNVLPKELQSVISNTKVISGHGSTEGETNFETTDRLYLLNAEEVYGNNNNYDYASDDEAILRPLDYFDTSAGTSRQLDYYSNLRVTPFKAFEAIKQYEGEDKVWLLRSAEAQYTADFLSVYTVDGRLIDDFGNPGGVSPAFRIA